jgi:hypothetical protein
MAPSATSAGGNALSTVPAWELVAMAASAKPAGVNNNAFATEPEKEMPRNVMGPVEAKIAAARSNTIALDDLADFADARNDSAEFDDGIDYEDSAFIDGFAQGTLRMKVTVKEDP